MDKWVLVTGAKGFVGTHLVKKLAGEGYHIVGLIRKGGVKHAKPKTNFAAWSTFTDLTDFMENKELFSVVHLATDYGQDGILSNVLESNVHLPLRLLDFCVAHNCFDFICADTFFGKSCFNYSHLKSYIHSKKSFVDWAKLFCDLNPNMRVSNLRLEHVYGEHDNHQKFVTNLIMMLKENRSFIPMTQGNQLRDFVYVGDVANAFTTILTNGANLPIGYSEYEIGTGTTISIKEFAELLHRMLGSHSELKFGALPYRNNEIMESRATPGLLRSLGWEATTTILDGITRTLGGLEEDAISLKGIDAQNNTES